jgi:hypothetical protein
MVALIHINASLGQTVSNSLRHEILPRPVALASSIEMMERVLTTLLARSDALDRDGGVDSCTTICEVRAITVCNAIDVADLARLATIAVVTEVPAGQCFVDEGEPATCFFVITAGTAKLFKLLPDGRRPMIRFVGPG